MSNFLEVFEDVTKKGTKIPTDEYLESGKYPIIDQGQAYISGYCNDDTGLFSDVPAIIFGDHTRVLKYVDRPCFLGADGVKLLKAKDKTADYKYLYYALCNAKIPNTGYNRHYKWLKEVDILIPDIKTQHQIAETLDKVTRAIDLCNAILEKLDLLVKARFVEMFDALKYPKVKTNEICYFITKGTTPPMGKIFTEQAENYVPFLKVYNLSFTGDLLFFQQPQYIPAEIHNSTLSRSKVYPNDVLMNIVGPPLGKFSIVSDEYPEWNINQAIAIFRAKEKILPQFLMYSLMQPYVLKPFLDQAVGIRQLNLSLEQCRNLEIALPPISLQQKFIAFVEQTSKSKSAVKQVLEKAETLKKALMQEYFR